MAQHEVAARLGRSIGAIAVAVWLALPGTGAVAADVRVDWRGPVVITRGGTYSGNWASGDPAVAAVTIRTTQRVVLQRCRVKGPGPLIAARHADGSEVVGVDLVVRDCRGDGVDPGLPGRARGHFLRLVFPAAVTVENNLLVQNRGIRLTGDNRPGAVRSVRIVRNRMRGLDGRTSDGAPCGRGNLEPYRSANGQCGASFVQLDGLVAVPGIEIAWNEVINLAGQSHGEDHINLYNTSGTPDRPIRVHDNYIEGAWPARPERDPFTGSAINAGDGNAATPPALGPAHIRVEDNEVVAAGNAGIIVAIGRDIRLLRNRVVSSGRLADGRLVRQSWVGIYLWDCCYDAVRRGAFADVVAIDNLVGFNEVLAEAGTTRRNDLKLDDCARGPGGVSLCVGNRALAGAITTATERAERRRWESKLARAGIVVGPRP